MKLPITIEFTDGSSETYIVQPPEWVKWEQKSGHTISQASEKMGISDYLFLAYSSMKRNAGGKAVKPLEVWTETIADVVVGEDVPKVSSEEA
jgi:hypothetical protein